MLVGEKTGFYYLKARYYSPEICRFICTDSVIDDSGVSNQNLFSYCTNNPIAREDSGGQVWNVVAGALLGATNGLLSTSLFGELDENTISERAAKLVSAVLIGAAEGALISIFPVLEWQLVLQQELQNLLHLA